MGRPVAAATDTIWEGRSTTPRGGPSRVFQPAGGQGRSTPNTAVPDLEAGMYAGLEDSQKMSDEVTARRSGVAQVGAGGAQEGREPVVPAG